MTPDKVSPSQKLALVNHFRRNVPVDVEGLAFALGVPVHYSDLPDHISGMIEPHPLGGFQIFVNRKHPTTRQRFTIAHELGHYINHANLIGSGVGDDRAYRSADTGRYKNTVIGPKQETEANRFAATLLMPLETIHAIQLREGINDPSVLAKRFEVSDHAMHIRMGVQYEPHPSFL